MPDKPTITLASITRDPPPPLRETGFRVAFAVTSGALVAEVPVWVQAGECDETDLVRVARARFHALMRAVVAETTSWETAGADMDAVRVIAPSPTTDVPRP